jgi:hypothetical protein
MCASGFGEFSSGIVGFERTKKEAMSFRAPPQETQIGVIFIS